MTEIAPTVLVDTREQRILPIEAYRMEVCTLQCGDYGVKGFSDWNNPRFIIERKSLDDLVSSLTAERDRFLRECQLLRRFQFAGLLVEAWEGEVQHKQYRSLATPQSILASLAALEVRYGIHVLWCATHEGAARRLETLVRQFVRGVEKDFRLLQKAEREGVA